MVYKSLLFSSRLSNGHFLLVLFFVLRNGRRVTFNWSVLNTHRLFFFPGIRVLLSFRLLLDLCLFLILKLKRFFVPRGTLVTLPAQLFLSLG